MPQDDWGFDDKAAKPKAADWDDGSKAPNLSGGGVWNGRLTAAALFAAIAGSALIQLLTINARDLDAVQIGLWFVCPIAAVLFSAFMLEYATSAMTPRFSRTGQAIVALIASVAVFLIGCIGQIFYLSFSYHQNNYIFLIDKSSSMGFYENNAMGSDPGNQRQDALAEILDQLPDGTQAGLVLFSDVILGQYPVSPLNAETRLLMTSVLDVYDGGGTDFYQPLRLAFSMLERNPRLTESITHVILLTDGVSLLNNTTDELIKDAQKLNAVISCIKLGDNDVKPDLAQVILATGGKSVNVDDINDLTATLMVVSEKRSADVLHDDSASSNWIAGFMFVLSGLALGVALSLMLSRTREFRFQSILSTLAGGAAFALFKFLRADIDPWIWNTLAFCLYGLVFMQITEPPRTAYGTDSTAGKPWI